MRRCFRLILSTVYVPMAESRGSFRPDLGEALTEAMDQEIEKQTPYKVGWEARNADSVLTIKLGCGIQKRVIDLKSV